MATNPFFSNYNNFNEQNLIDDLVVEAIAIYGVDTFYVTRSLQDVDNILNEDRLSIFDRAYDIEMYVKSVDGFSGDGDFLSKFGLQIRDQATFTVAFRTFERYVTRDRPYITRPKEGDLVYMPMNRKFFKITFVEHESVFYQTGALQVYDLKCELLEYSNERFETGNILVDIAFNEYKTDSINNINDLQKIDSTAKNIYYEEQGHKIIDFTELDPFSEDIPIPKDYISTTDSDLFSVDFTEISVDDEETST